jgi:hypothetical protein
MDVTKQRLLIQRLVDLTRVGNIDWRASSHAGVFEASFRENSVRIGLEGGRRAQERGVMIELVNVDGLVVESFSDDDIRAKHTSIDTRPWLSIMIELFEEARRRALSADKEIDEKVIDEILFDLYQLPSPPPAGEKRFVSTGTQGVAVEFPALRASA